LGTVYAVVLAAGRGERFGGTKLLATWRGRPLLGHVLDALQPSLESGLLAGGCVVVPADSPAVAALASEAGMVPLPNHAPASGLSSSLRIAFDWLLPQAHRLPAAAVIFLGDQPAVPPDVLPNLIAAWRRGDGIVIRPRYAQAPSEPGHPLLVDQSLWNLANELTGDAGFGLVFSARQIPIVTIETPGLNPDVDTPTELTNLEGIEQ